MAMTVTDIHPFVRNIGVTDRQYYRVMMRPYDTRLLYVLEGECHAEVNRRKIDMKAGALLLVTTFDEYTVRFGAGMLLAVISFDLTQERSRLTQPLFSDPVDEYREEEASPTYLPSDADLRGLYIENLPQIREDVQRMLRAGVGMTALDRLERSHMLTGILLMALRRCGETGEPGGRRLAQEVSAYLRGHLAENVTLSDLSARFLYHESYINRCLVRHTGLPAHKLLVKIRMERAMHLLQNSDLSVTRVAAETGYPDAKLFSRTFRRYYGRNPQYFR